MHYGFINPNWGDYGDPRLLAELAHEAEAAGWEGFFIWDHIKWPAQDPTADPWVALAAMAMRIEELLRTCLGKVFQHLARVSVSRAMRILFSAVPVKISTSLAQRRKCPSHAKVRSTTQRCGSTTTPAPKRGVIWSPRFSCSCTNVTAVPRYPWSPQKASTVGYFLAVRSSTAPPARVSAWLAACP